MIVLVAGTRVLPRSARTRCYGTCRPVRPQQTAARRADPRRCPAGALSSQARGTRLASYRTSPRSPSHSGRRRTLGRRLHRWARQGDVPNASPLALGRTTSPRPRQDPRAPRPDLTSPIRHPEAQLEDLLVALNVDRVGRFDRAPPFQLEAIAGCTPSGRTMPSRYPSLGS